MAGENLPDQFPVRAPLVAGAAVPEPPGIVPAITVAGMSATVVVAAVPVLMDDAAAVPMRVSMPALAVAFVGMAAVAPVVLVHSVPATIPAPVAPAVVTAVRMGMPVAVPVPPIAPGVAPGLAPVLTALAPGLAPVLAAVASGFAIIAVIPAAVAAVFVALATPIGSG